LRTPLAAIAGSASALVENQLDADTGRELARTIYEESDRLSRLVIDGNAVHLTRIEYRLLTSMIAHPGKVLTHRALPRPVRSGYIAVGLGCFRSCGSLRRKAELS
jgi:signal transduction histidine kinase